MSDQPEDRELEELLTHIRADRGFDFAGYKRTTLVRRIRKRMQMVGVESFREYTDYLQVHPDEFPGLFNTILINVTGFFRDPEAWECLAGQIIPRILKEKQPDEPVRVWSAGCASGEEAYTLAMLFAEAMGEDAFRERVKIYATDVDEEALTQARHAVYAPRQMAGVPHALREKYFERWEQQCVFRKDLRRCAIFGRHDLMQDAPISRIDLLTCRNTLMYFNAEAQARILARFHFALSEHGFLFLGRAEMLLTHTDLFTPVELKWRVFTRAPGSALRQRRAAAEPAGAAADRDGAMTRQMRLREAAFNASPVAQIVLDVNRKTVLINERARALFGLAPHDIGLSSHDPGVFARLPETRAAVDQVLSERRPVTFRDLEWHGAGNEPVFLDLQAVGLYDHGGALLGVGLSFADITAQHRLRENVQHAHQELETAYEELQSTNEELETTNEELQSTTEELETTNEELQSTNEELETMNEELQSTNQELDTVNQELRRRADETIEVNVFLESVLAGLRAAVVVMDTDMRVQTWSPRAEDLWGLRPEEAEGQHFLNLDIGLPVEKLRPPIRASLAGETYYEEVTMEAVNRRGRQIWVRITCTPLKGAKGEVRGSIILLEELEGEKVGKTGDDEGTTPR